MEAYHEALLSGKTTCEERTKEELSNIGSYDRRLNAFIEVFEGDDGPAVSRARELDSRLTRRGTEWAPPLLGVPVTVKDNIWFAGFPTTDGSVLFKGFIPSANAEVVDRLLGAGCVPLGKTNLHELALGVTATSAYGGPVRNPADPSRVSGGSSGGSAVSVAMSRGSLVSVGSDTGGSVRIPAALCGVCGFKPSRGLLSTVGVFPLSPSLDHIGIMTKTMPEMTSAIHALAGVRPLRKGRPRLGVPAGYFTEDMDERVSRDFHWALDSLRGSGEFDLREVAVEESYSKYSRARGIITCRESSWFYEEILRSRESRRKMHHDVVTLMGGGLRTSMVGYMHSIGLMADSIHAMSALLDGIDALIMPTCPIIAPKVDEVLGNETGRFRSLLLRNTELFNMSGLPALSLPIRDSGPSMPTALQVVGRRGEDGGVVSVAERAWSTLHPRETNR